MSTKPIKKQKIKRRASVVKTARPLPTGKGPALFKKLGKTIRKTSVKRDNHVHAASTASFSSLKQMSEFESTPISKPSIPKHPSSKQIKKSKIVEIARPKSMSSTKKRTVKLSSISKAMKVGKKRKDAPKLPLKGFKRPKNLNISKSKPLLFKPSEIKLKKVKTT